MVNKRYPLTWLVSCMMMAPVVTVQAYSHSGSGLENRPLTGKAGMITPNVPGKPATVPMSMTGVHFIENKGQITDQHGRLRGDIDFKLTTGKNINAFIGSGNIHYQWYSMNPGTEQVHTYRLDLALIGANKNAEVVREGQLPYFEKYYKEGSDGAKAQTWNRIVYKDIYPNIDWVLYLNGSLFEYDFVVHPGGRVSDIRLQYNGAQSLKLDKKGNLVAVTPAGSITEKAPVSFEESGKEIASRFSLSGNRLSFKTGNYNRQEKFIIDPVVEWATYYGGIGPRYKRELSPGMIINIPESDIGLGTAFDDEKNVYLTGYTNSLTNIATSGSFQQAWGGSADTISAPSDAFLVKFNAAGERVWATYYGGQGGETGNSITCDEFGNVYIAGISGSNNISLSTQGSHQENKQGASDAIIVKFDGNGNRLWATYFGGDAADEAKSIVSDKGGYLYVAGNTSSTTGLSYGSVHQTASGGGQDAFLAKFTEGGTLEWATYYGGASTDDGNALAWDAENQYIYLAGHTEASTNLGTPGVYQPDLEPTFGYDAYIAKFTVLGQREWGTYFGGDNLEYGTDIACDAGGNIYMSGTTASAGLTTPGAHQDTFLSGSFGTYLVKFWPDGNRDWCTYYAGNDLYVAAQGYSIYIGGQTADTFGIGTPGAPHEKIVGAADVYVAKFDTSGVRQWGSYFGSSANDNGGYLDCDGSGNIYLTGRATVPSAITGGIGLATPGAHQDTFAAGGNPGEFDAFLVKFSDCVQDLAITVDSLTLGTTGSSKYKNYQWYKNGVAISGATDSVYTVSENAMYSVSVVSALNGCPDSAFYEVTNIIEDDDDDDDDDLSVVTADAAGAVKVYPNPAKNIVYIRAARPVDVQIKSIEGKLVLRQQSVASVDISGISSGIYMLSITDAEGRLLHTEKLVKEDR